MNEDEKWTDKNDTHQSRMDLDENIPVSVLKETVEEHRILNQKLNDELFATKLQLMEANCNKDALEHQVKSLNKKVSAQENENQQLVQKLLNLEQQEKARLDKKEEKRRRIEQEKQRLVPLVFQSKVSSYPDFSYLKKFEIFVKDIDEFPQEAFPTKICFYVVHHTARFETVNLQLNILEEWKQKLPGMLRNFCVHCGGTTFITLAITPGTSRSALPAPKSLPNGDKVFTLWYQSSKFVDDDNTQSYKSIRQVLDEYK